MSCLDHSQDDRNNAKDIIVTAMENASWGLTKLATHIKITLDQTYGAAWHVSNNSHTWHVNVTHLLQLAYESGTAVTAVTPVILGILV